MPSIEKAKDIPTQDIFVGMTELTGLTIHAVSMSIGETMSSLSQKSGMSIPAIQRLGASSLNPSIDTIDRVSRATGSTITHISMTAEILLYDPLFLKQVLDFYEQAPFSPRKISQKVLGTILGVYSKMKAGGFLEMREELLTEMCDTTTQYRKWKKIPGGIHGAVYTGSVVNSERLCNLSDR